jgi:hypothetical protein
MILQPELEKKIKIDEATFWELEKNCEATKRLEGLGLGEDLKMKDEV